MFKIFIQDMNQFDRNLWLEKMKDRWSLWKDECIFCWISEDEIELVLYESKHWEVRLNKFPYYWKNQNLLALPKRHIEETLELNNEELLDFKNIEKFMKDYFKDKHYFSFIRQTDWWRSVKHIHYHYLEWIFFHDIKSWDFKIKL